MGAEASKPQPGTKLQVIGVGLPRTGTASFSEALRILLDGPVHHGGTQLTAGAKTELPSWIKLLSHYPPEGEADRKLIFDILKQRYDGYAALTDPTVSGVVEELMELYPDAVVICTDRDCEGWVKSMESVQNASTMWFLRFVLFPLPGMGHFVNYINLRRDNWVHVYGEKEPVSSKSYYGHQEYLERVVPKDKLLFYHVKEGWEPLCRALGKEVPDVPFPRINDGEAIDRLAKKMVSDGLKRWAMIVGALGAAAVSYACVR